MLESGVQKACTTEGTLVQRQTLLTVWLGFPQVQVEPTPLAASISSTRRTLRQNLPSLQQSPLGNVYKQQQHKDTPSQPKIITTTMAALPPWRQTAIGTHHTNHPRRYADDPIAPATTSYTSVNARRTLGAPPASNNFSGVSRSSVIPWTMKTDGVAGSAQSTSLNAQANNNNNRTTFPDKLKQYVARTFEDCSLEAKPEVEAELKRIITDAFNEKIVWTVDWDNMALPQTVMQHRKAAEREEARRRISAVDVNSPTRSLSKVSLNESKKRKRCVGDSETLRSGPPADSRRSNGEEKAGNKLADRIDKKAKHEADKLSQREKEMRAKRFAGQLAPIPAPPPAPMRTSSSLSDDVNNTPLVGRCQVLEKKFFRLTAAPNPDHVRPLYVLEKTLELLKKKWRTEQNYSYICDQFKSLRQDLTVQHIKNDFTVLVYEIHARIALEKVSYSSLVACSFGPIASCVWLETARNYSARLLMHVLIGRSG